MRFCDRRIFQDVFCVVRITNRSSFSCPPSTCFNTAAAARSLNVLHIGKRSSDRSSRRSPLPVSSAVTPIRPPVRCSIDRIRFAKSLVDPGVLAASNKSKAAASDETPDGLLSPRRKCRGRLRKLFHPRSAFLRPSRDRRLNRPLSRKEKPNVRRSRTEQFDRVIRRHGAGRMIFACLFHQVPGCRPVAVAIEQRADDAAIQDAGKRLVFRLRFPFRHDLVASCVPSSETADAQAFRVGWSAAETGVVRRVFFLK